MRRKSHLSNSRLFEDSVTRQYYGISPKYPILAIVICGCRVQIPNWSASRWKGMICIDINSVQRKPVRSLHLDKGYITTKCKENRL
ncbi:hypothetical protein DPMN_036026 [Dreissena polymorpha]|uniref:Uncharacterized protein n=1 Tax=Dreissena polymorpha TaxID=45954 RepID=A0A9D4RMN0_DREPO|nr:hypothetical protein DPMN_036026 [Dreissena polymorpha]